jgi:acyl-CoA reductase-like NAD-dependent aldehyde dehydrogenase
MHAGSPGQVRSFDRLFIGGDWITPASNRRIEVVSPISEQPIASVPAASEADIDAAVIAARNSFDSGVWRDLPPKERAGLMLRVADEIERRLPELIHTFTAEVGAASAVSQRMNRSAVSFWRWNAAWLLQTVLEENRNWQDGAGVLVRQPTGVVGAIIPWNGPVASIGIKMAPALAAGCSVVAKPSWEGPVATFILAEAIEAAGVPKGVVSILPADREVGEHLVAHPGVDKITFTGSTEAGRRIMEVCSRRLARVSLELGGKSAGIVCEDVDIDSIIPTLVGAGIGNNGQRCASITRVLVARRRYAEVVDAYSAALAKLRVGDPFDLSTDLGPLVSERQRDRVESYIALGRGAGARVVTGGRRPPQLERGWYIEPTLFADVDNGMRIAREEIFGPVIAAIPFDSDEEAIAMANDSDYGLSGAVYAADPERATAIARRIRSGQVFVNSAGVCSEQPFGGFRQSGFGREGGPEGIAAYLESQLIAGAS